MLYSGQDLEPLELIDSRQDSNSTTTLEKQCDGVLQIKHNLLHNPAISLLVMQTREMKTYVSTLKSASEVVQLLTTLCYPVDCMQPTRLLRPWDSSGKNLKWVAISFSIHTKTYIHNKTLSTSGSDGEESACNVGDPGSIPGSRKIPWRREWLSTPVFLPGECRGQTSLEGYNSPQGHKESSSFINNHHKMSITW